MPHVPFLVFLKQNYLTHAILEMSQHGCCQLCAKVAPGFFTTPAKLKELADAPGKVVQIFNAGEYMQGIVPKTWLPELTEKDIPGCGTSEGQPACQRLVRF